jgi:hypothetical protein
MPEAVDERERRDAEEYAEDADMRCTGVNSARLAV